jgi:hypothetical protein
MMTTAILEPGEVVAMFPALREAGSATLLSHHNYPGYLITTNGRVWSRRACRFLKPIRMGEYQGLVLAAASGKLVKRYLHRLILEIVTGECPTGMQGRHLDGNKLNNSISNLAWGTPRQNEDDKRRHGTSPAGERNGMARLTWDSVRAIRAEAASGVRQFELARKYGASPMAISRVVRRESWTEEEL